MSGSEEEENVTCREGESKGGEKKKREERLMFGVRAFFQEAKANTPPIQLQTLPPALMVLQNQHDLNIHFMLFCCPQRMLWELSLSTMMGMLQEHALKKRQKELRGLSKKVGHIFLTAQYDICRGIV